jgi:hypothetical protein
VRTPYTALLVLLAVSAFPQDQPQATPAPPQPGGQPQIKITYLNVCTPSDDEKKELTDALGRIPLKPPLANDYEVARGHSSMSSGELAAKLAGGNLPPSTWVRMRHEFSGGYFANAQYSMTRDENGIGETLVFRVRDPKDLMQVVFTDTVTTTDPAAVLAVDTPPTRIKLERFGKSSVGLTRCPGADQSAYQGLFQSAARITSAYRDVLGARKTVPAEFARLGGVTKPKKTAAPAAPKQKP